MITHQVGGAENQTASAGELQINGDRTSSPEHSDLSEHPGQRCGFIAGARIQILSMDQPPNELDMIILAASHC
ncbi:hypothetical protein GCM10009854_40420 [Saccharopolyspora halophila]|uniref:Uncharacterized protein n=1 Tax=Saccharopolyspora halophila TaxID=405551 RepID=A0ABN3GPX8_9PSEU